MTRLEGGAERLHRGRKNQQRFEGGQGCYHRKDGVLRSGLRKRNRRRSRENGQSRYTTGGKSCRAQHCESAKLTKMRQPKQEEDFLKEPSESFMKGAADLAAKLGGRVPKISKNQSRAPARLAPRGGFWLGVGIKGLRGKGLVVLRECYQIK